MNKSWTITCFLQAITRTHFDPFLIFWCLQLEQNYSLLDLLHWPNHLRWLPSYYTHHMISLRTLSHYFLVNVYINTTWFLKLWRLLLQSYVLVFMFRLLSLNTTSNGMPMTYQKCRCHKHKFQVAIVYLSSHVGIVCDDTKFLHSWRTDFLVLPSSHNRKESDFRIPWWYKKMDVTSNLRAPRSELKIWHILTQTNWVNFMLRTN